MRFSTGSIKRPPSYSKMADKPAEFLTTCADCGASSEFGMWLGLPYDRINLRVG